MDNNMLGEPVAAERFEPGEDPDKVATRTGSSCFEEWDAHLHVLKPYQPIELGRGVYMDMALPLPNYFISSGHNSYLSGNQLFSTSGTVTIANCLLAGCRVIELDVYNGPVCKHGGTLTSSVDFQECVEAIRDHAFVSSPYPVIVTIENHANPENQADMARILRGILGEKLYVPDPGDLRVSYASPEQLKGKVVCRTSLKPDTHEDLQELIYIRNFKFTSFADMTSRGHVTSSSFDEGALPKQAGLSCADKSSRADPAAKEAKLGAVGKAVKKVKRTLHRASSGVDTAPEDAVQHSGAPVEGSLQELYSYTTRHLLRVYPALWRVRSDNFNPMKAWVRGASLAALNWQVWDKHMRCNQGKFMDNGGCGYVLKPAWMRTPGGSLPARSPRALTVHVFSAYNYQGRSIGVFKDDLFVRIRVLGMPVDCAKSYTKTVLNSGRLVVEKDFTFDVRFPEMAVLSIELMDEDAFGSSANHLDADTLAYCTLSLATLAEGEFKLQMRSPKDGEPLPLKRTWVKVGLRLEGSAAVYGYQGGPKSEVVMDVAGSQGSGE